MLKLSLCDYSNAYILVSETITAENTRTEVAPNNRKSTIFENCAPFTHCIGEINNTQIDNAKDIDIAIPKYNLIEYSDNYSKASGSLWQYYRDERFLDANGNITDFSADDNNSASFKFKTKMAVRIGNDGAKNVEIMIALKYLSNFWRTLEISLMNYEINFILTWSANCFIIDAPIKNQVYNN